MRLFTTLLTLYAPAATAVNTVVYVQTGEPFALGCAILCGLLFFWLLFPEAGKR